MLDPARARLVLARLGFPEAVCTPARIAEAIAHEATLSESERAWRVAGETVHRFDPGRGLVSPNLVCSCPTAWHCTHVAAVLLRHARTDRELSALLGQPLWESVLGPLLATPAARPPERIHAALVVTIGTAPGPFTAKVSWRRRSRSGWTVPKAVPRDPAKLLATAVLTPRERAVVETAADLAQVRDLARKRAAAHRAGQVADRLSLRLVALLEGLDDVRVGDESVRASAEPVHPVLRATPDGDGLKLGWHPSIRRLWDAGIVLTSDGSLAPLDPTVPLAVRERLTRELPVVPAAELDRFVDHATASELPVALPRGLAGVREPDAREARLVLSEDSATLHVHVEVAYTRAGGEAAVRPSVAGETVRIAGAGLVARDADWEWTVAHRFQALFGTPDATELTGEEAVTFLLDTLPGLSDDWAIFGRDGLVRHQVRGTLTPSVGFRSGEDWFELDVAFRSGKKRISTAQVLASWLEGRRAVRLTDGSLAALPREWLERHGRVVDDLRTVRRAEGRLGPHAAWMASELLAECGVVGAEVWLQLAAMVGQTPQPRDPPPAFTATLRPYQSHGFAWLCHLRDHRLHGVLADDMGLGKTVQALAALVDTHSTPGKPSLVVCPTSVLPGWRDAAERFAPTLRVHVHHGSGRRSLPDDTDLVLTTWGVLRSDASLRERPWRWLILDEAQAVKNPSSQLARACRSLVADHRLAMTGTPVENHLTELWSLFTILLPGLLGSRRTFHARYAGPASQDVDAEALGDLRQRIRPFVLRRTKADVAPELPPRTDITLVCELSEPERRLYDQVRDTYRQSVSDRRRRDGVARVRLHVLEALGRLREAACHPGLLPFPEARAVRRSAKVTLLVDLLEGLIAEGRRALVFSQWPRLLHKVAEELPWRHLLLEGATRDRGTLVDAWDAPDGPPVFLISLKAGGTGLNLQAADVVILLDPWWNPAVEAQAIDRVHRIGQERPVTVYRLIARDTVEERVQALQARKRVLFDEVVERVGEPWADDLVDEVLG